MKRSRKTEILLALLASLLVVPSLGYGALEGGAFDLSPELALPAGAAGVTSPTEATQSRVETDPADCVPLLAQAVVTQGERPVTKKEDAGDAYKSPGKAFIFSAAAPGSGQLYVGAKRGYVYLGIEAVAWTTSYFFHKSGKQKEDEYMDFADQHWTFPSLGDTVQVNPDGSVVVYDQEHKDRIEYFYTHDKGHFYEDIGKYAYYIIGWDAGMLGQYLDMRDDSNRLLKNSSYALMGAVVNHVVSAVDALRLARNHNLSLGHGVRLNLKLKGGPRAGGVMLVASRTF